MTSHKKLCVTSRPLRFRNKKLSLAGIVVKFLCSFLGSQKRTKKLPLNSCVFLRWLAKAGAALEYAALSLFCQPSQHSYSRGTCSACIGKGLPVYFFVCFVVHLYFSVFSAHSAVNLIFVVSIVI